MTNQPKTVFEDTKIPFALSDSKGEWDFGILTKWMRVKTIHASTISARTVFTQQLRFLELWA